MHAPIRFLALMLVLGLAAVPAHAQALRLVSSDDAGVTFRVDVPAWRLVQDSLSHRSHLVAPGLETRSFPGRPHLPTASTLIALPPGARVSATVIATGDQESAERVALVLGQRPGWEQDPGDPRMRPTLEDVPPVLDGPWPVAPVEVGTPFVVRHQRMVAVSVSPFRYDEATGRLTVTRSLTVRVTFSGAGRTALGAAPATEGAADPTLEGALLNPEQGRRYRLAASPAREVRLERTLGATAAAGAAAFGFDEDHAEVRVKVDSTAVHWYTFEDLAAAGYPAGVPIAEVSVHRHEYTEGTTPPYATVEIPCEVIDWNTNGTFDEGDVVYVYVQSWVQRARPSLWQRMWGDADHAYVTRVSSRPAARLATRDGWRNATGLTPLLSYPQRLRYEHDTGDYGEYYAAPPDTSTDPYLWVLRLTYYARPDTFAFDANHLDPTRPVTISSQLVGRTSKGRLTWVTARNGAGARTVVVDSAGWAGRANTTLTGTIPGTALSEGRNHLAFYGRDADQPADPVLNSSTAAALNGFDVTLWRSYRAVRGYLDCNSGDASGVYQIEASGFTSNGIEVWDVTDSTAAVRLAVDPSRITQSGGTWRVVFQDSTGAGQPRRYVVFDLARMAPPEAYAAVTRRHLTEGAGRPDYLLVVPAAWESAVQPLVDARRAQGLEVLVAPYEAIRDEFNGGRASAHAIKRFIRHAYANWDTRYVTLVGDAGGEDPLGRFGGTASKEWLPTMLVRSPVAVVAAGELVLETIPSDSWYGWCVDPACTDPSLAPKLHDLYVGRLPVNSATEAAAVATKLANYDVLSGDQTWRDRMLLSSDDMYSGLGFGDLASSPTYCRRSYEAVFATLNSRARAIIRTEAGLANADAELFDLGQYLVGEDVTVPSPGDTCRVDRGATQTHTRATATPALLSRLSQGRLWWNYQGHASQVVMTHENLYFTGGLNDDWRLLTNTGKPFLFSAFSCHANNFGMRNEGLGGIGPCIGEELVNAPAGGAIASWASSGYEVIPSSDPGLTHINLELARALFSRVPPDTARALRNDGDPYAHPVLGDAIALALMKAYRQNVGNPYERDVGLTYTLLGDPATRLSISAPQTFVTANGLSVTSGEAVRLHTLGDTARIVADLVSNQALTRIRVEREIDGAQDTLTTADYTISPAFPDTARGGLGGRRYQVTHRATLTTRPHRYTFRTTDARGTVASFVVAFPFQTVLRAEGTAINDGDAVAPTANLTLLVISPAPIADPQNALVLRINGEAQAFTATQNLGDVSGREWVLSWAHAPYAMGLYGVELFVDGVASAAHSFQVAVGTGDLRLVNTMMFPNPFEDDLGTWFSFDLQSGSAADVVIRVFTASGRLVYRRSERQLAPGYHQLAWDGRDAEGDKLANGVYFYRIHADNGASHVRHEGRFIKLRKPRRVAEPATP